MPLTHKLAFITQLCGSRVQIKLINERRLLLVWRVVALACSVRSALPGTPYPQNLVALGPQWSCANFVESDRYIPFAAADTSLATAQLLSS
jgi:hypothetical protein